MSKAKNSDLPVMTSIDPSKLDASDFEMIADIVSEYLTDTYGFCHNGFTIDSIRVSNIQWDTQN